MRILMLAQWYPPILGGEELHVANLSRALAARGHDVMVVTLRQAGLADEELDGDVRVVRVAGTLQRFESLFSDAGRRSAAPIPDPALTLAIDRIVRRFHPDVLHAHNWLVHAALPIRAARGIPLVQTLHDFSLVCAQKVLLRDGRACSGPGPIKCLTCTAHHYGPIKGPITAISNRIDAIAQRRLVDRFIPVSRAVADGTGIAIAQHPVIPNFVPDALAPVPEPDSYSPLLPAEPYFLFIGALGRLKGLEVLLEAYRADESLPSLVLIGYRMRETEELLQDLPQNVVVLGEWPHAAIQLAWPGAIAGVLPSICQEACPTVAIEAMRAGRAVIASRLGGSVDLVEDQHTGILVAPDDPIALARALHQLAGDPHLAAAMGARARERSGEYVASAVVPRIEAVYRSVTEPGRVAPASASER
jgi:glycosyltransferase involved in cell wall biosynthesis